MKSGSLRWLSPEFTSFLLLLLQALRLGLYINTVSRGCEDMVLQIADEYLYITLCEISQSMKDHLLSLSKNIIDSSGTKWGGNG